MVIGIRLRRRDPVDELPQDGTVKGFAVWFRIAPHPVAPADLMELNVSLYDAFAGTTDGLDEFQFDRFILSQAIVMSLEGIPAFYIHSLIASRNDLEGVERLGYNRAINRRAIAHDELEADLANPESLPARTFSAIQAMLEIRLRQPAFHPNATQFTLQLGDPFFGIWRQSLDRSQSIFAIFNLTAGELSVPTMSLNLIGGDSWEDLLTGDKVAASDGEISFAPYQVRWITNRPKAA